MDAQFLKGKWVRTVRLAEKLTDYIQEKKQLMITRNADLNESRKLLDLEEGHFIDLKSREIAPAKLQQRFVAFANADGGELFIGIRDKSEKEPRLVGFDTQEDTNGILATLLEETNPSVENIDIEFIDFGSDGYVLHLFIPKSPKVHYTASGECFIRIGAAKKKIIGERITQLAYSKGVLVYEHQPVEQVDVDEIIDAGHLSSYMDRIETKQTHETFLRKQRLVSRRGEQLLPNVGCVLLFDDEPQASLPTRCAIKIYRLLTTDSEYKREQLAEMPTTINGPLEDAISATIRKVDELLSQATYHEGEQLVKLSYPVEAIKEVLVNAAIHRDYSLNDDIHVRIFDNRIEVQSPGRLPGYMTVDTLYSERYSRNPNIVRLLHKLPDPLNHDIGEGLDTARNELRKAGLVEPVFQEMSNAFQVTIRHQRLASIEDVILKYFADNPDAKITNKLARELSGEDDINRVKKALQKLRKQNLIEPVDPNARPFDFEYMRLKD